MASRDQSATHADRGRLIAAWPYALVLAVGAFVLLPALGSYGMWDPWEPIHAEIAREMMDSGSLFVPRYGGEIRLTEPPQTHWSIMLGSAVFGANELGARVGGALLGLLAMLGVYYGVERMRGRRAGLFAALVLGSSALFYFPARHATPEIYLLATSGLALLFFCLALFRDDDRRRLHFFAGSVALALALLSRGPLLVGAIVLAPPALYGMSRIGLGNASGTGAGVGRSAALRAALLLVVVVVVVAGPWYATVLVQHGDPDGFLSAVQPTEEVKNQSGGFNYYIRDLIFGFFPWSCFIPLAMTMVAAAWVRESTERNRFELCMLLSSLTTFVTINGSDDPFPQALAPLAIPLAVLLGITVDRMLDNPNVAGARISWAVAAMLYLPAMLDLRRERGLRYLLGSFTVESDVPDDFDPGARFAALLALIALALLISILVRSRIIGGVIALAAVLIAAQTAWVVVPAVTPGKTLKGVCEAWQERDPGDTPLGFYGDPRPGALFYSGNRLRVLNDPREFFEHMAPGSRAFSIVEGDDLADLDRAYRRKYDGHRLHMVSRTHPDYFLLANEE